ncbi:hypothetical protein [Clostridium chrysemydis]|uniref:hypothetical protein n=1 Tax=Clostridium chrysemydis TaxID=2665504 RepID=UPI003F30D484
MDIGRIITKKLIEEKGEVKIKLLRGKKYFVVKLVKNGVEVSNLGKKTFLEWKVFKKTIELLEIKGGIAEKGDAMNSKLGEEGLLIDSIEGYIAKEVYNKNMGDSVFRRITPIVNILIWVGVCENSNGYLKLK